MAAYNIIYDPDEVYNDSGKVRGVVTPEPPQDANYQWQWRRVGTFQWNNEVNREGYDTDTLRISVWNLRTCKVV